MEEKKYTLLVADDEQVNFYLLEMWLKEKYNLAHVTDGTEVLFYLKKYPNQVDLIVMDLNMPILNGKATIAQLRKEGFTLPIIVQSAFILEEELEELKALGCDDVIEKPLHQKELEHLLVTILKK
ncbi:response regulator [Croceivirga sp. JEA036]|uniref:response regulator n=1 Tax=Croceivirga sp. JEA036 TaxID=2721162 RepID=UPI00143AD73F|nr:response regulator [Croceivirga sp. JEA036]NJB36445.1 response regulator [Croceivirga sp. JEA036]